MSGYLTNLLKRALDPSVAMVQPRLNALFAPPDRSSLWLESRLADQEQEPIEHWTHAAEASPAPNSVSRRPVFQTTRRTPTEPLSSPSNAASTSSSPEVRFNPEVAGNAAASQSVESEAAELSREELEEPLQPATSRPSATSVQIEHAGKPSLIEAHPSQEMGEVATEKRTARVRQEQTGSLARAGKGTAKSDVSIPLLDQRLHLPGASFEVRAGAPAPHPPHSAESNRPAETHLRDAVQADAADGREQLAPKTGTRKLLPAFPLPSEEKNQPAVFRDSNSPAIVAARGPLAAGSARLREARMRAAGRAEATVPTIEVTIGRIEVRGPAPAEPHRATAKPSAGLSLEEYLRRRSGRSRE